MYTEKEVKELLAEHDLRCEEMHPLFMAPLDSLGGRLVDIILEYNFYEACDALGFSDSERDQLDSRDDLEELLYAKKLNGYLACFAKPIVKPCGDRGSYSFSWGYYRNQWLYAESISDLVQKAIEWADEVFKQDMAK